MRRPLLLTTLLLVVAHTAAAQERALRLYISADMEGVSGVVTEDQLGPGGFEYDRFREVMTREVLAAIRGARAAGVRDVLISDSHGNGENLLLDLLPADVQVVRSWPRPLGMMEGIDSTFDAVFFLGYHAGTTNSDGVRAHTFSSARLADVRINGRSVPEAGINAAIAGHFGVPVVLVTGDDAAAAEIRAMLGEVDAAVVKWNVSFHSARTLMPAAAYALIEDRARSAISALASARPYRVDGPVTLDVRFKSYRPSQVLAYLPIVERTDAHSIRFVGDDILAVSRFLQFMTGYSAGLEP